jgi:hypothetical protein
MHQTSLYSGFNPYVLSFAGFKHSIVNHIDRKIITVDAYSLAFRALWKE